MRRPADASCVILFCVAKKVCNRRHKATLCAFRGPPCAPGKANFYLKKTVTLIKPCPSAFPELISDGKISSRLRGNNSGRKPDLTVCYRLIPFSLFIFTTRKIRREKNIPPSFSSLYFPFVRGNRFFPRCAAHSKRQPRILPYSRHQRRCRFFP